MKLPSRAVSQALKLLHAKMLVTQVDAFRHCRRSVSFCFALHAGAEVVVTILPKALADRSAG